MDRHAMPGHPRVGAEPREVQRPAAGAGRGNAAPASEEEPVIGLPGGIQPGTAPAAPRGR